MSFKLQLCIALVVFVGCSSSQPTIEQTGNYKITVLNDGEAVADFNKELVHRVFLTQPQIEALEQKFNQPDTIKLKNEKSLAEDIVGVFPISSDVQLFRTLAFERGDVLTAVNRQRISAESFAKLFFESLKQNQETTMTIQRRGMPHKLIYIKNVK